MEQVFEARSRELDRTVASIRQEYLEQMALGTLVRASDVADLVVYLCSPAGDRITGQAIDVAAGYGV